MKPVVLRSERLVLSVPTADDADRVYEYCQDPLFERYLTVPWPYRRQDATHFLTELVPRGWDTGDEYTWALRSEVDGPLLGMVGSRVVNEPNTVDIGYWLGAPHRGHGLMAEAVRTVTAWIFEATDSERILWECIAGNNASAHVARDSGFSFTEVAPGRVRMRDGSQAMSWHGERARTTVAVNPWPPEMLER